jgi:hypothetical protein
MTQLRKYRDSISNYFDDLTQDIGKRGSSFMDIDAVSHDKDTGRFLFQEFKQEGEALHPATKMVLRDLAGLPRCTVWFVRRIDAGRIGWAEFGSGRRTEEVITTHEYRERFRRWWSGGGRNGGAVKTARRSTGQLTAAEIHW